MKYFSVETGAHKKPMPVSKKDLYFKGKSAVLSNKITPGIFQNILFIQIQYFPLIFFILLLCNFICFFMHAFCFQKISLSAHSWDIFQFWGR